MTTMELAAMTALAINAGAIIWGAAKLSSSVEHLDKTVREMKTIVMQVQELTHNIVGRIWVLEDRLDIPHRRVTDTPNP